MQDERPCILHVINDLSMGGAELLLKNTVELLPEFDHTIVYLFPAGDLEKRVTGFNVKFICLEGKKPKGILFIVLKLRKIIKEQKPILVHSHLFYSTICTRLATPASIPLVSTIHSVYSKDAFEKNFKSLLAARLTLKKRHSLIGVSHYVLEDYFKYIRFRGNRFVLHNFLPDDSFQYFAHGKPGKTIKLVAVGNLKEAKNYLYLLEIIKHLDGVSLDIYGSGGMENELKRYIETEKLNVRLCGATDNITEIFQQYDFFIQASLHEGFGLSVIEAMGAGIPVLLSDIPVFREITGGLCNFFSLNNPIKAAETLTEIFHSEYPVNLTRIAYEFVKEKYSADKYREGLLSVYEVVSKRNLKEKVLYV